MVFISLTVARLSLASEKPYHAMPVITAISSRTVPNPRYNLCRILIFVSIMVSRWFE